MAVKFISDCAANPHWRAKRIRRQLLVLAFLPLLSTVACQPVTPLPVPTPGLTAESTTDAPVTEIPAAEAAITEEATMSTTPALAGAPALADSQPVRQAIADLARTLALDTAAIEVVEASPVVWPDGSLGCPEPGMMYTQVTVEGIRIILRAQGQEYNYHGGGNRDPFLCENPA